MNKNNQLPLGTKVYLKNGHVWRGKKAEIIGYSDSRLGPYYVLWVEVTDTKRKAGGLFVNDTDKYEVVE